MLSTQELADKIYSVKHAVLDMCIAAGKGHLTTAYSCAEIVTTLYYNIMKINPSNPSWEDRDRFIMSKNHGSLITYPILADLGFFDHSELTTFMTDGTRLGGHSKLCLPGVDFAGGSLGIGLGVSVGLAYSAQMNQKDWITFCILGDAECYEGSIWESAMLAGHLELSHLVAIVDRNRLGITGFTEDILKMEPFAEKWEAFGWETRTIDGHDTVEIQNALSDIRVRTNKRPLVIIANTVKGHGIDFMSNEPLCHGVAPKAKDIDRAYAQLEVNRK